MEENNIQITIVHLDKCLIYRTLTEQQRKLLTYTFFLVDNHFHNPFVQRLQLKLLLRN